MSIPGLAGLRLAITGVDGFVGRHLARIAKDAGAFVVGISRATAIDPSLASQLDSYCSVDLRQEWPSDLGLDAVIHLAGRSAVGPSFADPQGYIQDNSAMVTVMCEALLRERVKTRIVGVSSGAVYASPTGDGSLLTEDSPLACSSPYVISKLLLENQLKYYGNRGLPSVIVRPFNHIGPDQGPGFLLPDLLQRLRLLAPGEFLDVGNLETYRDYTDVRDIARGYLMLAAAPELQHDLYNVASGRATSGTTLLEMVCAELGREVPGLRVNESLVRPTDTTWVAGSARRMQSDLGWEPKYALARTLSDAAMRERERN